MATVSNEMPESISQSEADLARESSQKLARVGTAKRDKPITIRIETEGAPKESLVIPAVAFRLLQDILTSMAEGNAVTIIPIHAELSTQEAANILNVSRPFLIELLEKNQIPFHKVGTHRRVHFQDLMKYKNEVDRQRRKSLDELAAQAQELNMGYDD